tara:strand:- start:2430 stop:3014 length:585 start_codon:yes stop_codon:yes gene_type:complete
MNLTSIFDNIYLKKIWLNKDGGTESGPGSCIKYSRKYIDYLMTYIREFEIKSILDVGCGDLNLMRHVLQDVNINEYLGIDISKVVTDTNIKNYPNYNFKNISLSDSDIIDGEYELCLIKDVLQHMTNDNIVEILSHIYKFKHTIIVNDYKKGNEDCVNGGYRGLDLTSDPFNLNPKYTFLYKSHNHNKEVIVIR